jgi:hypothetical protein
LADILTNYLTSQHGRNLVSEFRTNFKSVEITEMKMLDLVLWQLR